MYTNPASPGIQSKIGKPWRNSTNYFSGTDEERLTDLEMLDDDTVKGTSAGGYGIGRIVESISFKNSKASKVDHRFQ
jgi:muramoyltetrapeptide carboxypeptidase